MGERGIRRKYIPSPSICSRLSRPGDHHPIEIGTRRWCASSMPKTHAIGLADARRRLAGLCRNLLRAITIFYADAALGLRVIGHSS